MESTRSKRGPWRGACSGAFIRRILLLPRARLPLHLFEPRYLALVEQFDARVHFCRITTRRALGMIARAQYDGLPVTADIAVPYLFLTEMDVADFDAQCHVLPPLRTQEDRDGLREGLLRGTASVLCSDHQPHEADAKLAPFPATEPGISGLDSLLPMALRLVEEGAGSLEQILHRLTAPLLEPARPTLRSRPPSRRSPAGRRIRPLADKLQFTIDKH